MKKRKLISILFISLSLLLGIIFFLDIDYPEDVKGYFKKTYYGQFGPLAICVELFIAAYYLLAGHKKSNFALALFAIYGLAGYSFQSYRTVY